MSGCRRLARFFSSLPRLGGKFSLFRDVGCGTGVYSDGMLTAAARAGHGKPNNKVFSHMLLLLLLLAASLGGAASSCDKESAP